MDVFLPGPGDQVHDLNPTAFPPVGLFWTVQLPDHSVRVDFDNGNAILEASHIPIFDYGSVPNALFAGGPPPVPGFVSFKFVWSGVTERVTIRNTDPVYGGFAGEFIRNSAQIEWTAVAGDFTLESDPMTSSSSAFAEIGQESNGSFF